MYRIGDTVRVVGNGSPLHGLTIGSTGEIISFTSRGNPWVRTGARESQIVGLNNIEFVERTKYKIRDCVRVMNSTRTVFNAGDVCKVTGVEGSERLKVKRLTDGLLQIISLRSVMPNNFSIGFFNQPTEPTEELSTYEESVSSILDESTVHTYYDSPETASFDLEQALQQIRQASASMVYSDSGWRTYPNVEPITNYATAVEEEEEEFVYIRCLGDRPNGSDYKFAEFQSHASMTLRDSSPINWEGSKIIVKKDTSITWLYREGGIDFFLFKYQSSSCIVKGKINSGKAKLNM